jgi:hypothetical protein
MNSKKRTYTLGISILCIIVSIILFITLTATDENIKEVRVGDILTIKYDGAKFQAPAFVEVNESPAIENSLSAYLEFKKINTDSRIILELSNNIASPSNAYAGFNFIARNTFEESLTMLVSDEINSQSKLYCREKGEVQECGFWDNTPQVTSYPSGDYLFEQFMSVGEFTYTRITIQISNTIDDADKIKDEIDLINDFLQMNN